MSITTHSEIVDMGAVFTWALQKLLQYCNFGRRFLGQRPCHELTNWFIERISFGFEEGWECLSFYRIEKGGKGNCEGFCTTDSTEDCIPSLLNECLVLPI